MSEQQEMDCAPAGPVEQHKLFEQFVGTWKAEVTMWMGPGEPMVSTGTMVNSLDLGGRYLKQDYKGDATDGPFPNFEGRGFWGFNDVTGKFEGLWIDNASNQMATEQGGYDASSTSSSGGTSSCGQRRRQSAARRTGARPSYGMQRHVATESRRCSA